jgi:Mg-chelatase subunit ChlD
MSERFLPYVAALIIVAAAGAGAYFLFFKQKVPGVGELGPTGSLELRIAARRGGKALQQEGVAVEVLFDASGSMKRTHPATGRRKIDEAKEALQRFAKNTPRGVKLGLRVFGTSTPNTDPFMAEGCRDTKQLIPVGQGTPAQVLRAVEGIRASGWTPLSYSMLQVIKDFEGLRGTKRLVVVTDGRERCQSFDGNPPEAVKALQKAGIEVKVAFIGHDTPPAIRQALTELVVVGSAEVLTLASPRELREVLSATAEAISVKATATHQSSQKTFPVSTVTPSRVPTGTYSLEVPPIEGVSKTTTRLSDLPVQLDKTTRLDVLFVEGEAQVEITTR